jgi:putative solute:sodium symporter small subunit
MMPDKNPFRQDQTSYWYKTLCWTAVLLVPWFLVTFVAPFFSEQLNQYNLLGLPLGYFMGAQGSLLVYLVLIGLYALIMNRLDRRFGVDEQ